MEDLRKTSKITVLDQRMPGPVCGDPDCEELCAEAFDAALSLRLDPVEVLRKTIQRELHCIPAEDRLGCACRFGFLSASDSLVLGGEKEKKDKEEIIHIFRTGVNECKKCQALEGTRITPEVWADEEKMKSRGFWKQKNGKYLPHPNCRCGWAEEPLKTNTPHKKYKSAEEVSFHLDGDPGVFGLFGGGYSFNGLDHLIEILKKENYEPHGINHLIIIAHSGSDNNYPVERKDDEVTENLADITDLQAKELKCFLNENSVVELRMCRAASDKEGMDTAQMLADKLGCTVRVYGGFVSPSGGYVPFISFSAMTKGAKKAINERRLFPNPRQKDFQPKLDKD